MSQTVLRLALARPHVMVLQAAGGERVRLAVDGELRRRGWPSALSPADTDVLVLAGTAGSRLAGRVRALWRRVPEPRLFLHVGEAGEVPRLFDGVREELAGGGGPRTPLPESGAEAAATEGNRGEGRYSEASETRTDSHAGTHGEVEGHEHHAGTVEGLAMAGRGPDRDGLALDRLHVPLGSPLPGWPPGLLVHTVLQGDVLQWVEAEQLDDPDAGGEFWGEPWRHAADGHRVTRGWAARRVVAARLDSLAGLLTVVGWPDPAGLARRIRDETLAGGPGSRLRAGIARLAGRLRRSRTLTWLTSDIGVLSTGTAHRAGFGGTVLRASRAGGDVAARWREWLTEIERGAHRVDDTSALSGTAGAATWVRSGPVLEVLPGLLEGAELSAARLTVASLDPRGTGIPPDEGWGFSGA
ncbi:hypothetical protein [Actinopolyspora mortivallis]|uniref:Uncharacterized protein n=1 Tax=Actinopolyspora mortivallis TaxID=33906 RepID=A0A2T0GS79_ACTMO|nr:hypothetical protein [Actinopolyspora mortivallis]PRW61959.1 hypothetical protein CEP50_18090 [Actinopolyspora mortivallis]